MFIVDKNDLDKVLQRWNEFADLYGPRLEDGQVMLMPYLEEGFTMDYVNFAFPIKEHLFRQREVLFSWEDQGGQIHVTNGLDADTQKKSILFGVRPCEVDGLDYMDTFFLSEYRDEFYARNRQNTLIVAVNCIKAGDTCFCSSMGTGPFATRGYDLLFTPIEGRYLVEVGSEQGTLLLDAVRDIVKPANPQDFSEKETLEEKAKDTFVTRIHVGADQIAELLDANFDHPIWAEKAKDCITCTGCTILCPTCTCFNVVEEHTGKASGCRVRYWDSCQSDSFTRNANQQNPRDAIARVRYRVMDKFKYIEERFDKKGCNGCGRCISVCPAAIDVVEIINQFAKEGK